MKKITFKELSDGMMSLYTAAKYTDALRLVEQNADSFPEHSATITMWRMCLLSMCGRPADVMSAFRQGLDSGLWWAGESFGDTDFDSVRDMAEFKDLVAESHKNCLTARTYIKPDRTILVPDDTAKELPLLIALHGRYGNKDANLEYWDVARQRGWLVLSPQSTQALNMGAYCWDDPAQGIKDILPHIDEIKLAYKVDPQRVLIGGFSQGSGMSIYMALNTAIIVRGFIGVGTWWRDASELACEKKGLRGYFVTGEKDHTLDRAREIQNTLQTNNILIAEEVHANLGHEFPASFAISFEKALDFILGER